MALDNTLALYYCTQGLLCKDRSSAGIAYCSQEVVPTVFVQMASGSTSQPLTALFVVQSDSQELDVCAK
jgi:hypothetical protein